MPIGPIFRAMLRNKLRFGLIAVEVALTLAIVVNAAAMIADARRELARTSGMPDDDLVTVYARLLRPGAAADTAHLDALYAQDLAALRGMPGVRAATGTRIMPWMGGGTSDGFRPLGSRGGYLRAQIYDADESTFDALGLQLVEGHGFTERDVARQTEGLRRIYDENRVRRPEAAAQEPFLEDVVISRAFAEAVFGGEPPLGKVLEDRDGDRARVVGVVGEFYNPYPWGIGERVAFVAARSSVRYVVRAEPGRRDEVLRALEPRLLAIDRDRDIVVQTVADLRVSYDGQSVLVVRALSLVLALVVFVTLLGVVGVTSFSVAERTRQIGIRRAIGATRRDVVAHFLLESSIVSGAGLALGVGLAYALNVALVTRLGAGRIQPASIAAALFCLALGTAGATLVPALRAAKVAPTIATRSV